MGGYYEKVGNLGLMHTGVFVTDEERRRCERVHHADAVVSMLEGKPAIPADRIRALFIAYGLPAGEAAEGKPIATARLAVDSGSNELVYAWQGGRP